MLAPEVPYRGRFIQEGVDVGGEVPNILHFGSFSPGKLGPRFTSRVSHYR
jgi:hypothetical protein